MPMVQATDVPAAPPGGLPQAGPLPANAYQNISSTAASFGSLEGTATEQLGTTLERAANLATERIVERQQFQNKVVADQRQSEFVLGANDLLHGNRNDPGDVGFYGKRGADAALGGKKIVQDLADLEDKLSGGLNPQQQLEFRQYTRRFRSYALDNIGRHIDVETHRWNDAVQTSKQNLSLDNASTYNRDPARLQKELLEGEAAAVDGMRSKLGGTLTPEMEAAAKNDFRDKFVPRVVDRFLSDNDPAGAKSFLDSHRELMTDSAKVLTLENRIKTGLIQHGAREITANTMGGEGGGRPSVTTFRNSLNDMIAAAAEDGVTLSLGTPSRTFKQQTELYNDWVAGGRKGAPVAKPGTSKHEIGLANDLRGADGEKIKLGSAEDKWITANENRFNIHRPVRNKDSEKDEPWHAEPIGSRGGAPAAERTARMPAAIPSSSFATPGPSTASDPRGMEPVIRAAASAYGHDPDTAVKVAAKEGLLNPIGDGGASGGAFQLYTAGGLGNEYQKETGRDPRDPKNEVDTIYWAMRNLDRTGWTPYKGAPKAGVGVRDGIGLTPAASPPSTKTLAELEAEGMARVDSYAARNRLDDDMTEQLRGQTLSRIRAQYNTSAQAKRGAYHADLSMARAEAIAGGPGGEPFRSIDAYLGDPARKERYDRLTPADQLAINHRIATNPVPLTPERMNRYSELHGMATASPDKFLEINPIKEDLPDNMQKSLLLLQDQVRKHAETDFDTKRALGVIESFGYLEGTVVNKNNNPVLYHQFVGALSDAGKQFKLEHKRSPNNEELRTIATDLLKVAIPGSWNPLQWNPVLQFETVVPNADREEIKRGYNARYGVNPNPAQILQIYKHQLENPPTKVTPIQ